MLAGQIVIHLPDRAASECWARRIREGLGKDDRGSLRRPEARPHVIRVEIRGLVVTTLVSGASSSHPSCQAPSPFPALLLPQFSTLRLRLRLSARSLWSLVSTFKPCGFHLSATLRLRLRFQLFAYQG